MVDLRTFVDPETRQKWDEYSFKKAVEANPEDYSFCPTPDCKYVFVWEGRRDSNELRCPICSKHYCLNCRCEFHTGETCQEHQITMKFSVSVVPML